MFGYHLGFLGFWFNMAGIRPELSLSSGTFGNNIKVQKYYHWIEIPAEAYKYCFY